MTVMSKNKYTKYIDMLFSALHALFQVKCLLDIKV